MKNLIIVFLFILCFSGIAKSQGQVEVLFAAADTTETVDIPGGTDRIFITISDSAAPGTDSIAVYAITKSTITQNSPIATHSMNATALTTYVATYMIPGDGLTNTYNFNANEVPGGTIKIVRLNRADTPPAWKTRIAVNFK